MSFHSDPEMRDELRKPFDPKQIGKLPATPKRPAMDFVGHAAVTDRLNKAAPDWTYSDITLFDHGGQVWIKGTMTIGGVSRIEYGDGDDPKQALGNFIRRGAMRFGVALDLWSKEELNLPASPSSQAGKAGPGPAGESKNLPPDSPATTSGMAGTATHADPADSRHPEGTFPSSAAGGEAPSELVGEADSGVPASPPAAAHRHEFTSDAFEKDGRPISPRKGWEVCTGCLDARKAA